MKRIGVRGMKKKFVICISVIVIIFLIYCWMPSIEGAFQSRYGMVLGSVYLHYITIALCVFLAQGLVFGFITSAIADSKGYDGGFWWGFFLGILGLIVVAVRPTMTKVESDQGNTAASYTQALERLAAMRDQGVLTQAEFEAKKQEILNRI